VDDAAPVKFTPRSSDLGERLAALAAEADAAGLDAETELRAAIRQVEARIKELEAAQVTPENASNTGAM
jgi:hypothetical protein